MASMSIPTEDQITAELDRQVKTGIMERVRIGNQFKYRFSNIGKTIMDKIFNGDELDQKEKDLLLKAGLNLESLKMSTPKFSQDSNQDNES